MNLRVPYFFKKIKIAAITNRIPPHQLADTNERIANIITVIKLNGIPNLSVIKPVLIKITIPNTIAIIANTSPPHDGLIMFIIAWTMIKIAAINPKIARSPFQLPFAMKIYWSK